MGVSCGHGTEEDDSDRIMSQVLLKQLYNISKVITLVRLLCDSLRNH